MANEETCSVCGQEVGKYKAADGYVCATCYKRAGYSWGIVWKRKTIAAVKADLARIEDSQSKMAVFTVTQRVGKFFEIDEINRLWVAPLGLWGGRVKNPRVYSFDDIVEYELLEDGDSVVKSGGLGRALAGGILFGGVGAIVGGATAGRKTKSMINSLKVKVTVNDMNNPAVYICFIESATKAGSMAHRLMSEAAQKTLSMLALITKQNEERAASASSSPSTVDGNSIFCSQCGNKMTAGSLFCSKCGTKLN